MVSIPTLEPGLGAQTSGLGRQALKVAGSPRSWERATNGILEGCPQLVIVVNVQTTI